MLLVIWCVLWFGLSLFITMKGNLNAAGYNNILDSSVLPSYVNSFCFKTKQLHKEMVRNSVDSIYNSQDHHVLNT